MSRIGSSDGRTSFSYSVRLLVDLIGLTVISLYAWGLFIRDPEGTFVTLSAAATPLLAAAIALLGVRHTLSESRRGAWWSRAQWVIQEMINNADDPSKLKPLVRIVNDLYESDPPSDRHAELLSRVVSDIYLRVYEESSRLT